LETRDREQLDRLLEERRELAKEDLETRDRED
jgi:hypothetical protein